MPYALLASEVILENKANLDALKLILVTKYRLLCQMVVNSC